MTNPLKGQIEVTLGSETYKCRLTIDSLVKIEDELDQGILELAQNISQAKVRIKTLLVVLRYALRGGGNYFDEKKVGQIISNIGIITAYNDMLSAHKVYENYPEQLREYARGFGAVAQVAGAVPAMCDGVTQGQPGM